MLAITPDGNTLIGVGATMLMTFDLTRSMAPSSLRGRPPVVTALRRALHSGRVPARSQPKPSAKSPFPVTMQIGAFRHASQH